MPPQIPILVITDRSCRSVMFLTSHSWSLAFPNLCTAHWRAGDIDL